jgi:hypothetical protein
MRYKMTEISLVHIDAFAITDDDGKTYFGGDQTWLPPKEFHREAACGATTCANILSYYSRTGKDFADLRTHRLETKTGFTEHLKEVYRDITPGPLGTMPKTIIAGAEKFASDRETRLRISILKVPCMRKHRAPFSDAADFITAGLERDLPIAFLNLSNGGVKDLDSYHWVTIAAINRETGMVRIVDNGELLEIDLKRWIERSAVGGAFLLLEPV